MGRLQEFLANWYGFPVTTVDSNVTLNATTPTAICNNDPNRVQLSIFNLSATAVYIGFTAGILTATTGIFLAPNGGFVTFLAPDDGEMSEKQIWGLAAAGTPSVYVVQEVAYR